MIEAIIALFIINSNAQAPWIEEVKPVIVLEHDGRYIPTPEPVAEKKKNIQDLVAEEFGYDSVMWHIARCESNFRQFDLDGSVLKSHHGTDDWGIFQINRYYHLETATKLGHDFMTIEGNIAYAKWLYQQQGVFPWNASKPCWSKT